MKKEICFAAVVLLLSGTFVSYADPAGKPDQPSETAAAAEASATSGGAVTAGDTASTGGAITDGDTASTGGAVTAGNTAVLNPEIDLSLKEAVKIMQTTGTRAETAELNRKTDMALARGYEETVKSISKVLDGLDLLDKYSSMGYVSLSAVFEKSEEAQNAGATATNKKVSQLRRDFAKGQIDNNYQAEMNQIEYDTLRVYYGVLLAADNLKTEQDNLKTQQDILKNTKIQYEVGMLAKKDVLSAQSAVTAAQSGVRAAETKLEYAKMSFNFLLGYPVIQEIHFTDSLDAVTAPAIDLDASVKNALEKRNEIKGAKFAVEVHKILLDSLKAYPKSSATYMSEQIALMSAEKLAKDVPVQIEIDIRNKAAGLEDRKAALEAARAMQAYAEEGFRLIRISYDAGMSTLAELQQAQSNVYKAGLAVSAAISEYDLAVYDLKYAQDVGTDRLSL